MANNVWGDLLKNSTLENNPYQKSVQITSAVSMFLLQGGIGLYYSGLSRAKNGLTPLIAVLINTFLVIGCVWGVGFTFAWTSGNEFIGYKLKWFGSKMDDWDYIPWILHACYTATVVNIACGGIIERGRPVAYFTIAVSLAFFIHPVLVHWAWHPEGWLQTVKPDNDPMVAFRDTGGSCVIHICAGVVGFIGAILSGNRQDRIVTQISRKVQILESHSAPMVGLGGVIMYFGLIGLQLSRTAMVNSRLQLSTTSTAMSMVNTSVQIQVPSSSIQVNFGLDLLARVVMNIFISSLASVIIIFMSACLLNYCNKHSIMERFHWPMINSVINGALVGLVSVAAGCDHYYSYFAFVVGVIGAFVYMFYCIMIHICLIDDPADTFAVHFGPGFWGVLAVAIFSRTHGAVFYGENSSTPYLFFAWNLVGAITITAWCAGLTFVPLMFLWAVKLLRIRKEREVTGVDENVFKEFAYPLEAWKRPSEEQKTVPPGEKADAISHVSAGSEKPLKEAYVDTYHHRPEHSGDEKFFPYPYYSREFLPIQYPHPEIIDEPYWSYSRSLNRQNSGYFGPRGVDEPFRSYSRRNWYAGPRAKLAYRNPYGSLYRT